MAGRRGNGEGSIYPRKDGKWVGCVSTGFDAVTGKPTRRYVYGATRKEAQDKLREMLNSVAARQPIAKRDVTIETIMTEYLDDAALTLRPKTLTLYKMASSAYIVPRLGKIKVADLTAQHVAQWQRALLKAGAKDKTALSARTVQITRALLKRAIDLAIRYDWVSRNVVDLATAPTGKSRSSPNLSHADAHAILAAFDGHYLAPLITVLMGLGLRIGEALGMCWEDIDMRAGRVKIHRQLATVSGGSTGPLDLVDLKTKGSRRTMAMPAIVIEALETQRKAQEEMKAACERAQIPWRNEWGLVFTTGEGNGLVYVQVRRGYRAKLAEAGIEGLTLHDMRHLCTSLLVSQGVHPRVIMGILGHSQIATTMNIYAAVMPGVDVAAASALDKAMGSKTAPS